MATPSDKAATENNDVTTMERRFCKIKLLNKKAAELPPLPTKLNTEEFILAAAYKI